MTLQEAKSIARHLWFTLRKVRSGDYRVRFRDGNEITAYYEGSTSEILLWTCCLKRHRGERVGNYDCRAARRALMQIGAIKVGRATKLSAPAMSDLSRLNPTPHAIAVYASRPLRI